ncbi:phage major capsid protein, P2 family [Andreprevotia lacus DSM 23236]|jgi:P2 family phage major capsid protein|uniref:Phage major capsid protein, P2 family n=1 Tax=Andreprevotia lacus DSM 23236 TaxID=1121001 RepID=A0A1W1XK65_9NEIS|nr:phage major capsid protein, P2 family [Andreprevotia lacus]SMC24164.1 phage major capsid protein, P2 family [Andreprevotia lacus DSM 23236]
MKNETRLAFNAFVAQLASLNGIADATKSFTVAPSVQQTLENKIQLSSEFLTKINMPIVVEQESEKLGLGVIGTIAGRTNTKLNPRRPRNVADMSSGRYRCVQTNFDTAFSYEQLDMWARFPDFQTRLRNAIVKQQALDRIMIGFNGVTVALQTDRVANPLLQDVNIGWLQKYRTEAPQRVMNHGTKVAGKVTVGPGGDYENLDALVFDAVNNMIEPQFRKDPDLVVVMSDDLLADKYFPLINKTNAPTEQQALDMIVSNKRVGGKAAVTVPFFPDGTILITKLANLSLYTQEGARRRNMREEPDYDQVADYQSANDAYVVEAYEAGCMIENIQMLPQVH